jgi:hypothetical protein
MKLEKGDNESSYSLRALQTTILGVCVVSVIGLGGSTPFALKRLKIKTAVPFTDNVPEGGEVGGQFDDYFQLSLQTKE